MPYRNVYVPADALEAWDDVASREKSMSALLVSYVRRVADDYGKDTETLIALDLRRIADRLDRLA